MLLSVQVGSHPADWDLVLTGSLNWVADSESKMMKDWCDWKINLKFFQQICQSPGPLLFASRLTKKLPRNYSLRSDPEAETTDTFAKNWAQVRGFANPPWCLISRCLNQNKTTTSKSTASDTTLATPTLVPG